MKKLTILAMVALAGSTMGCATTEQAPDTLPGEFGPGQGQEIQESASVYPEGATGWDLGNVIANLKFVGYAEFTDPNLQGLQLLELAHFYNPTGTGTFPADHSYKAGLAIPKALNILTSAVWCPPCKYEAASVLPDHYDHYSPLGGHFITVLLQANDGSAAGFQEITDWVQTYPVSYSIVVDPNAVVSAYTPPAFPSNIIVRTKDMKIIKVTAGVPQDPHWKTFDDVLNDLPIPGID